MKKRLILLAGILIVLVCTEVSSQANVVGKIVFTDASANLYVGDVGGTSVPVPLSGVQGASYPHWSPDAQWITFAGGPSSGGNSRIWVVRPDGSGLRSITDGSRDMVSPSFSPDGAKILFDAVYGHLFTVNVDDGNLTDLGVTGGHAEWSPDGTKISYTNWGLTYESDIFIYDIVSQTSFQLTHHDSGEAFNQATWAPNGDQLAIAKRGSDGDYDICRINANGTGLVNLTEDWTDTGEYWTDWSPDGQYIFFDREISGKTDIWCMLPDGSNRLNVTNSPEIYEAYFDVIQEPAPIQEILSFIEESVADGILTGSGPGKSAEGRLGALINMIEAAGDLIDANDPNLLADICTQLQDAYNRTDGNDPPPDFVTGQATAELAQRIEDLMVSLGCE